MITLIIIVAVLVVAISLGWDSLQDVLEFVMGVKTFVNSDEVREGVSVGKDIVSTVIENSNQNGD
mgnify:CR=1 FL=1